MNKTNRIERAATFAQAVYRVQRSEGKSILHSFFTAVEYGRRQLHIWEKPPTRGG